MATTPRVAGSRRLAPLAVLVLPLLAACSRAQGAAPALPATTRAPLNVTVVSTAVPLFTPPAGSVSALPSLKTSTAPTPTATDQAVGGESDATTLVTPAQPPADAVAAEAGAGALPVRVQIAKAGVDANIVPLGETADGAMATPATPTDVGWWQYGVAPGAIGSAVLGGHLDFHDYGAAVFWNLNRLKPGDAVVVTRADGTQLRFIVQSSAVYAETDTSQIDRIFRQDDAARLNLITCAGVFNPLTRDYNKRLVVYTTLAQ